MENTTLNFGGGKRQRGGDWAGFFNSQAELDLWTQLNANELFDGLRATVNGSQVTWRGQGAGGWVGQLPVNRNRVALFGNSIGAASYLPSLGATTAGVWVRGASVSSGEIRQPISFDLRSGVLPVAYQASNAGTCGQTEPIWPTKIGSSVVDGDVTWTAVGSSNAVTYPHGGWTLAQARSGQQFDEVFMVGASGQDSQFILGYRDKSALASPDVMAYLHIWENDVTDSSASLETIKTRFSSFASVVASDISLGRKVIVSTALPRSIIDAASSFTGYSAGAMTDKINYLNYSIRKLAKIPGVFLADIAELYIDPNYANPVWPDNSTTFTSKTGTGQTLKYTQDGTHPWLAGHWAISSVLAKTIALIGIEIHGFAPRGSSYDLISNPLWYGTAGSASGASGVFADKVSLTIYGTAAGVTGSQVARTDGPNGWWQRIVGAHSADLQGFNYGTENLSLPVNLRSIPVQGFREYRILAGSSNFQNIQVAIGFADKTLNAYSGTAITSQQGLGQFIASDTVLLLKTPPVVPPSGATLCSLYDYWQSYNTASYTIDVGRGSIRSAAL